MTTHEAVLHPPALINELKKNNITHIVWLPDCETNFMYQMLMAEPSIDLVPVCREGETMAIAARESLHVAQLEKLTDVDTVDALAHYPALRKSII